MRILILLALVVGCGKREGEPPFAALARSCSDAEMGCPRPILSVRDLRAAQHYYRDQLGFTIDWDYGDPPDFGSVSRSDAMIFLCLACQGTAGGGWVWIFTRDVDQLHDELVGRGATIRMPPTDMPWGMREMQVADRDGNVIRFASPSDH